MNKSIIVLSAVLAGSVAGVLPFEQAEARGGLNASYARAYCEYYRTKSMTVGRYKSKYGLRSGERTQDSDRKSPAYWRAKYRECLKEHGY